MAKRKFLIDTSAVPAATGHSTPEHCRAYVGCIAGGTAWTSVYIRKEFLLRFISDGIVMALAMAQCRSPSDALHLLSQDFKTRRIKSIVSQIARIMEERGGLRNVKVAAEEFASATIQWLELFDELFASMTQNHSGCRIGGLNRDIDYDELLDELHKFYIELHENITTCGVNDYLDVKNGASKAARIFADDKADRTDAAKGLKKILSRGTPWIDCKNCPTIGDVIIALEQPPSWTLVHTDGAFDDLSRCLGKNHEKVPSMRAVSDIDVDPLKIDRGHFRKNRPDAGQPPDPGDS